MGRWEKLGMVFAPDPAIPWMRSHAQLPSVLSLGDSTYRIYFASRDDRQYSHVGFFDIDMRRPERPLRVATEPVLAPGPIGNFDEHGVYPSCLTRADGRIFLYYIGWNKGERPPMFYASIGLAISDDGGSTFRRHSVAPIMSRSEHDPCLVTAPFIYDAGGSTMAYVSGLRWFIDQNGQLRSEYHLKLARSQDGLRWERDGRVAIDFKDEKERNISRCCVIRLGSSYHMWYGFSGSVTPYRIGYAFSTDGLKWERRDHLVGIDVSKSGFDNEMIGYPAVLEERGHLWMFYNGNAFGKAGVGLARLALPHR